MSELQIAIATCGLVLTYISAGFGIFWKIVDGAKNEIKVELTRLDQKVDARHEENRTLVDAKMIMLQAIRDQMLEKPSYEYNEKTFAKKDITELQLRLINEKLDSIKKSVGHS